MDDIECYCWRCSGDPPCHITGDHDYGDGATCRGCGHMDGSRLAWMRYVKATKEGRAHGDHHHRSLAAKDACRTILKHPLEHYRFDGVDDGSWCPGDPDCNCWVMEARQDIEEVGFIRP